MSVVQTGGAVVAGAVLAFGIASQTVLISPATENPAPFIQVVCNEVLMPDPEAPPVLSGCSWDGYPVIVQAPAPNPL